MTRNTFKEEEMPYGILLTFGLTREMIEDLPLHVLQQISKGQRSPVLPICITDETGNIIRSRTRFSLIRNEEGKVDVLFYPQLQHSNLSQFTKEQQTRLLAGKAIINEMPSNKGKDMMAFHQIDSDTGQVLSVPTPVIGRNIQLITDEFHLSNPELNCLRNGDLLTISLQDEIITIGIDLNEPTGIRLSEGDEQRWRQQSRREWGKHNFGCFGCWMMDEEGNLDYIREEDYTEEMWDELKKKGEKRAGQAHKI